MNVANLTVGVRIVVGGKALPRAMWRIRAVGFVAALLGVPIDVTADSQRLTSQIKE